MSYLWASTLLLETSYDEMQELTDVTLLLAPSVASSCVSPAGESEHENDNTE